MDKQKQNAKFKQKDARKRSLNSTAKRNMNVNGCLFLCSPYRSPYGSWDHVLVVSVLRDEERVKVELNLLVDLFPPSFKLMEVTINELTIFGNPKYLLSLLTYHRL